MSDEVSVGAFAPDFRLAGSTGTVSLNEVRHGGQVLLFFMREFSCMICQQHVQQLSRLFPQFQTAATTVLVIGGGKVAEAQKLAQRYSLPFPVLADTDHRLYDQFGLSKVLGMLQRSAVAVVAADGRIRYLLRATLPTGVFDKSAILAALNDTVTA